MQLKEYQQNALEQLDRWIMAQRIANEQRESGQGA